MPDSPHVRKQTARRPGESAGPTGPLTELIGRSPDPLEQARAARDRALAAERPSPLPPLGAFTQLADDEDLVRQAAALAAGASGGRWRGMPAALKDLEAVRGMRLTRGSRAFAPHGPESAEVSAQDGPMAAIHRAQGAVLIGTTQVPELGLNCYSENLLGPPTRNPWDLTAGSGGSSGGQAAAVAAGILPAAIGSDGGGSIRIPAAACGLIGLKPGRGAVPAGDAMRDAGMMAVQGPIARTADDAALLLDGITDALPVPGGNRMARPVGAPGARTLPDPWAWGGEAAVVDDPFQGPAQQVVHAARQGRLPWGDRPLRVRVSLSSPFDAAFPFTLSAAALQAVAAGSDALQTDGARLWREDLRFPPSYPEAFRALWTTVLAAAELPPEREALLTGLARAYRAEARERTGLELVRAVRLMRDLETALLSDGGAQGPWDVVLTPAVADTPRPLGWWWEGQDPEDPAGAEQDYARQCRYTPWSSVVNMTGLPAVVVPVVAVRSEVSGAHVPMGVQLIGRPGSEAGLLVLADRVRQHADWDPLAVPAAFS